MAEEDESKENVRKSNQMLIRYFFVVLLLGAVAVGILLCTFDTAFVERGKWIKVSESQRHPDRLIIPGRGNIYSADGKRSERAHV